MRVRGIDERHVAHESIGASFVVFIYRGDDQPGTSWSVESRLLTDADMVEVLRWLTDNLPAEGCWSLGVVREPVRPTTQSDLDVAWIVGADVLNVDPRDRSSDQQRIAEAMMARRHQVPTL